MMETIKVNKKVFGRNTFKNTINTDFSQLIKPVVDKKDEQASNDTIDNFFRLYDLLFYEIPKEGILSHQKIITDSTEYVGITKNNEDIQVLLDEISELRTELLNKDKIIIQLTSQIAK